MESINLDHFAANRRAISLFRSLNNQDQGKHLVTVWFYGEKEENIYLLASTLQKQHIPIVELTRIPNGDWLCIGLLEQAVEEGAMEQLYQRMLKLAHQHEVVFDGWEARLDL